MKINIFILFVIVLFGQIMIVSSQSKSESYYVKYITLMTDPNPRFVWHYANSIVSFEKYSNHEEATCLKRELIKTGFFSKIKYQFAKLKDSDDYQFVLTIQYKSPNPVYKLKKITLIGLSKVDKSKFNKLLASENLIGNSVSLKRGYWDFEDKILELIKKSIPIENETFKLPYITPKLNKNNELEIEVVNKLNGCSDSR